MTPDGLMRYECFIVRVLARTRNTALVGRVMGADIPNEGKRKCEKRENEVL